MSEDKGISLGESSILNGKNIFISGAEIGIASKDLSSLIANNVEIQSSKVAYVAFQKKPEFGPGKIIIDKAKTKNIKTNYLLEKDSSIKINGSIFDINSENVEQFLYGNIYGKKSGS